jgi:hypothetical protein
MSLTPVIRARFAALALALALPGCGDDACTEPSWQAVFYQDTQLDRAVLSAWGTDDDVVVVGGALGAPGGALMMRWDGAAWSEIQTGRDETLWWVWSQDGTTVWAVGEDGVVLRCAAGACDALTSGTTATLYGVWGAAEDDVWIVGGEPGPAEMPDDVVLHWDGATLAPAPGVPARTAALFKVWGASSTDLWVSGEGGTMLHRTATGWEDRSAELDTIASLFTVHGCAAGDVWAVGGTKVFHYDGAVWSEQAEPEVLAGANGVSCSPSGILFVGFAGLKMRFDPATSTWHDETFDAPYDTDFHGALVTPDGEMWATGGNFLQPAAFGRRIGTLGRRACP